MLVVGELMVTLDPYVWERSSAKHALLLVLISPKTEFQIIQAWTAGHCSSAQLEISWDAIQLSAEMPPPCPRYCVDTESLVLDEWVQ